MLVGEPCWVQGRCSLEDGRWRWWRRIDHDEIVSKCSSIVVYKYSKRLIADAQRLSSAWFGLIWFSLAHALLFCYTYEEAEFMLIECAL